MSTAFLNVGMHGVFLHLGVSRLKKHRLIVDMFRVLIACRNNLHKSMVLLSPYQEITLLPFQRSQTCMLHLRLSRICRSFIAHLTFQFVNPYIQHWQAAKRNFFYSSEIWRLFQGSVKVLSDQILQNTFTLSCRFTFFVLQTLWHFFPFNINNLPLLQNFTFLFILRNIRKLKTFITYTASLLDLWKFILNYV
jgi:hypothetical protein